MDLTGRYANMVAVGVGFAALVGGITAFNAKVSGMELATAEAMSVASTAVAEVEKQAGINAQQSAQIAALTPMITNIYRRGLIVQGKALVLDVGDTPYVELNSRDPNGPTRLSGFVELSLTNLTHPDMIMTTGVKIGPSMSNATPGYVMNLSRAAGEILHARPGAWIDVRATPVFEEDK